MRRKWMLPAGLVCGLGMLLLPGCGAQLTDLGVVSSPADANATERTLSPEDVVPGAVDATAETETTEAGPAHEDDTSEADASPEFSIFDAMVRQYEKSRIPVAESE